jgi:hypothetical protein
MHSDLSDQHPENAYSSILFNREFSSKVTHCNPVQLENENLHRISTDAGMRIDSSVEYPENALSGISQSLEPDSNASSATELPVTQPLEKS